jgi:hypothetical protein
MADHNDPNAVNSIFSDVDVSAADLYDLFGFPNSTGPRSDRVVIALTFAPVPATGAFDTDLLYRIHVGARPRIAGSGLGGLRAKYFGWRRAAQIRVSSDDPSRVSVDFRGFPEGDFSKEVVSDRVTTIESPGGHAINAFVGGRDDAFFNDLPGFFRSINYAPQFYAVPREMTHLRELKIPKTLLELEGNDLFNFDPRNPEHGQGVKLPLPSGPLTWKGSRFRTDDDGNFRFVYSGRDAQAGRNVNAIVLELPLAFITRTPGTDRVVDAWGESWVRRAADKIEAIPDSPSWLRHPFLAWRRSTLDEQMKRYKRVDTVGQPFADAGLNEREDGRQRGANNLSLARHFVRRLAHLGWGFGPSITALGLRTSFDHGGAPVSIHKTHALAVTALSRAWRVIFQRLNMPDDTWNRNGLEIRLRRPFGVFVPNVCAIDMDTTGTWPFGRRLEDQVANRFLAMFLDMRTAPDGKRYHLETLSEQALWDDAPVTPKTSPNPLRNDKDFLEEFPYLAAPW